MMIPAAVLYLLCGVAGGMVANILPDNLLFRQKKRRGPFYSKVEKPLVGLIVLLDALGSGRRVLKSSMNPMMAAALLGFEIVRLRRSYQLKVQEATAQTARIY